MGSCFCLVLVSSGQNACAQITAASCLSRVVKAPVLKLRPFISLVLSVPKDKYLEGRLFLLNFRVTARLYNCRACV